MTLLLQLLAGFVVFATFWATIPRFEWWFRVADFPRNQLIFSGLVALIGLLWLGAFDSRWQMGLILLLLIASVYGVALYVFVEETSANGKAKITRLSSEIVGCQCVDDQSK